MKGTLLNLQVMNKTMPILVALCAMAFAPLAAAQQPLSEEEQQKKMYEYIDKQVEDYASSLDLNSAQIFWADSILTHNNFAMVDELTELQKTKMSIADAYSAIQDKWNEATYEAFHKILNEEQWAKYLKTGGSKDKKARDKRAAKRAK